MGSYSFTILDIRSTLREAGIGKLRSARALGIGLDIPEFAEACRLGNIVWAKGKTSLVEIAVDWKLPPPNSHLVATHLNIQTLSAMAVFVMRRNGLAIKDETKDRVVALGKYIQNASKWSPGKGDLQNVSIFEALEWVMGDNDISVADRVGIMGVWLYTGILSEFEEAAEAVRARRNKFSTVFFTVELTDDGRIAFVESADSYAISASHLKAEVVVVLNPESPLPTGEVYTKISISQKTPNHVDLSKVFSELNIKERGWGGNKKRGGSPKDRDTALTLDYVVEVVQKHLR